MRQFWTMLKDALCEALDRWVILVVLLLTLPLILACFVISFEPETPDKRLQNQLDGLEGALKEPEAGRLFSTTLANELAFTVQKKKLEEKKDQAGLDALNRTRQEAGQKLHDDFKALAARQMITVGPILPARAEQGWGEEVRDGECWTLTFPSAAALDDALRRAESSQRLGPWGRADAEPPTEPPAAPQSREQALADYFRQQGWTNVEVRPDRAKPETFQVAARTQYPHELLGAHKMYLFFGWGEFPLATIGSSQAQAVIRIQRIMANWIAGLLGISVALMVCSFFVPSMLQKGTLDLVLARPLGRGRLLLYKYLGGVLFVALLAAFFIGGCWLGLSLRTGYVNPWFLLCVVTVTLHFAVVYAVSVLVGVVTRSGLIAALVAIAVWWGSSTVVSLRQALVQEKSPLPQAFLTGLDAVYWVLPKVGDLGYLNTYFLAKSHLSPAGYERLFGAEVPPVNWGLSIGTTVAFTAVVLGLAVWRFRRRDY